MAKSKRSKVKMAYRAMRRVVLQPRSDAKLQEQASKVYNAIGLPMPIDRDSSGNPRLPHHGGSEIVTTFTPTPKGPKLNAVHGPLSEKKDIVEKSSVVGFPLSGSGTLARTSSGVSDRSDQKMDIVDEEYIQANTPYFYPRRYGKRSGIRKNRHSGKRRAKI